MMHRKPDESGTNNERAHTESALQVDTDSMTISANQETAMDLAAEDSASLKNEFNENTIEKSQLGTPTMETIQSAETATINTFQTSTADSTEFFESSYYYIIEVRISLK